MSATEKRPEPEGLPRPEFDREKQHTDLNFEVLVGGETGREFHSVWADKHRGTQWITIPMESACDLVEWQ